MHFIQYFVLKNTTPLLWTTSFVQSTFFLSYRNELECLLLLLPLLLMCFVSTVNLFSFKGEPESQTAHQDALLLFLNCMKTFLPSFEKRIPFCRPQRDKYSVVLPLFHLTKQDNHQGHCRLSSSILLDQITLCHVFPICKGIF